jgi:hypothetical protein
MRCIQCGIGIREKYGIFSDILKMMGELRIPLQGQSILLCMAFMNVSCKRLKEILSALKGHEKEYC